MLACFVLLLLIKRFTAIIGKILTSKVDSVRNNTLMPILASLLIAFTLYWGVSGWQLHQQRRQKTADRGWRYTNTLRQSLFRSAYIVAGTTANGIVWELRRSQKKEALLFNWTTTSALLPYGVIYILPRRVSAPTQTQPLLRLTIWQHERWQNPALADYVVLTSHQQLGERFLTSEAALALSHWPEWPLPGASPA
jgi:hypothetical protein